MSVSIQIKLPSFSEKFFCVLTSW